ncbi:hypothetical protein MVEN_00473500 [Mycena venus]|uniref:Uncharacterized protein n=1 Tax=Mycena venus TaxID=2733690 RepID=A0A8H6YX82_9AGAR|nr:hypothetical protein MVEN_00473500 [Mycena venus]
MSYVPFSETYAYWRRRVSSQPRPPLAGLTSLLPTFVLFSIPLRIACVTAPRLHPVAVSALPSTAPPLSEHHPSHPPPQPLPPAGNPSPGSSSGDLSLRSQSSRTSPQPSAVAVAAALLATAAGTGTGDGGRPALDQSTSQRTHSLTLCSQSSQAPPQPSAVPPRLPRPPTPARAPCPRSLHLLAHTLQAALRAPAGSSGRFNTTCKPLRRLPSRPAPSQLPQGSPRETVALERWRRRRTLLPPSSFFMAPAAALYSLTVPLSIGSASTAAWARRSPSDDGDNAESQSEAALFTAFSPSSRASSTTSASPGARNSLGSMPIKQSLGAWYINLQVLHRVTCFDPQFRRHLPPRRLTHLSHLHLTDAIAFIVTRLSSLLIAVAWIYGLVPAASMLFVAWVGAPALFIEDVNTMQMRPAMP